MNLKALVNRIAGRSVVSLVTAAAIFTGTTAIAYDDKMPASEYAAEYTSTTTVQEVVPRNIIRKANDTLVRGETVTIQEGSDGLHEVEYRISYTGAEETGRTELSRQVLVEAVDKIVEYGTAESVEEANANSLGFEYKYVIECTATAYDPSPEENGGYGGMSATGVPLQKGVIAVDPKVIPLGSRVYIEALDGSWSYGYAVAADTGGAIKGNRVDLLFLTKSECYQFGRRACRVYVL